MNFIQSILGLVTRRKFLTNLTDRDTILVARDNARENAVRPNLEPKALKLKNLKDYVLLDNSGKQPYIVETLISEIDVLDQRVGEMTDSRNTITETKTFVSSEMDKCIPIMFQQDTILQKVDIYVRDEAPVETKGQVVDAFLGLYEFTNTESSTEFSAAPVYIFKKVYQDPLTFNVGDSTSGASQSITLNTPQVLKAGKVYTVVVCYKNATEGSAAYQGHININMNPFLSINLEHPITSGIGTQIGMYMTSIAQPFAKGVASIPISGGMLPEQIAFFAEIGRAQGDFGNNNMAGYKFLTVKNA